MDAAALQVDLLGVELEAVLRGEGDRPDPERHNLRVRVAPSGEPFAEARSTLTL